MTEIKESLEKLKAASKLIEEHEALDLTNKQNVRSLRDRLFEMNQSVEQLKVEVNEVRDSPIRFSK